LVVKSKLSLFKITLTRFTVSDIVEDSDISKPLEQLTEEIHKSPSEFLPKESTSPTKDSTVADLLVADTKHRRKYRTSAKVHSTGFQPLDLPTVNKILVGIELFSY
jgi:hypothetical protein